jgi:hypothetical protein
MISRFLKIVVLSVVVLSCALSAWATTPRLIQVTLGTGATQVSVTPAYFNQMTIQNNSAHNCRYGDSTTSVTTPAAVNGGTAGKGILLTPGGAGSTGTVSGQQGDASQFYIAGTQGDVIDVLVW